jgi:hypothetical protein
LRKLKIALTHASGDPSAVRNVDSTVSYSLLNDNVSATPDIIDRIVSAGSEVAILEEQRILLG